MQKCVYQNPLCSSSARKSQSNMHKQIIGMSHFLLSVILSSLLIATSAIIPGVLDLSGGINIPPTEPQPQNNPVPPTDPMPGPQGGAPEIDPTLPHLPIPGDPNINIELPQLPHLPNPGDPNRDPALPNVLHLPKPGDPNMDPALPHLPKLGVPNMDPALLPKPLDPTLPNSDDADLSREFLKLHNSARRHAKLPPYVWDVNLEEYAKQYAWERAKGDCGLVHSMGPYGENLFWGKGSRWKPRDAVRKWIKEHKFYDQETTECKTGRTCGHYTQVVWRDSTKLGCAVAKCKNDDTFTVCSYDPPGNYLGEKPYIHYEH